MSRVRVGFSFLLFNGLLFLFCGGKMIFSFYSVCLLHELGHLAALRLTGGELRRAELSFFGIKMVAAPAADIGRGAVVLLSGPTANLLLYAVLCRVRIFSAFLEGAERALLLLKKLFQMVRAILKRLKMHYQKIYRLV